MSVANHNAVFFVLIIQSIFLWLIRFSFNKFSRVAERNVRYTHAAQWMSSVNGILLVRGSSSTRHRRLEAIEQQFQLLSLERREERQ